MLYKRNPQLNKNGELIHLLSIEGLPKDILTHILDTAANFTSRSLTLVKLAAVSRMCVTMSLGRPSIDSRWISSPFLLSCGFRL